MQRRHAVVHEVDWLFVDANGPHRPAMPDPGSIARVESEVERDGKISRSTRCYLSSARLSAERFAKAVRAHWLFDMVFGEDRARNRKDHGAEN